MTDKPQQIVRDDYFTSPIYWISKKEWLTHLDKSSNIHIDKRKKELKKEINERNKKYGNKKDHGYVFHSTPLVGDPNFNNFQQHVIQMSYGILDQQGFDLTNHKLVMNELWVQEFAKSGGGHHTLHTHWNGHISGFYFLKISPKTSFPVFEDPRPGRNMNLLPEKDKKNITHASSQVCYYPNPGDMILFNSYLPHLFMVDNGYEPFRFIHFNVQAIDKRFAK